MQLSLKAAPRGLGQSQKIETSSSKNWGGGTRIGWSFEVVKWWNEELCVSRENVCFCMAKPVLGKHFVLTCYYGSQG
jgi:hypothetical protein